MNEDINEYMDFFKNQSLKEKQSIIYEQLKMSSQKKNIAPGLKTREFFVTLGVHIYCIYQPFGL